MAAAGERSAGGVYKRAQVPAACAADGHHCMETLKREFDEPTSMSSLVLGTEAKQILILEPAGSAVEVRSCRSLPFFDDHLDDRLRSRRAPCTFPPLQTKCNLKSVPAFMAITGLYKVDYRIVVACVTETFTIKGAKPARSLER